MEWLGRRGAGSQQGREFLEQLLYLGRECGDGGDGLRAPGVIKRICTCLGEGAARGRVQDLPFSWEDSKLKFLKKIHSNNWSSYSGKVKVEFEIQIVESDCLAAAAPDRENVPVGAHEARACGRRRA